MKLFPTKCLLTEYVKAKFEQISRSSKKAIKKQVAGQLAAKPCTYRVFDKLAHDKFMVGVCISCA